MSPLVSFRQVSARIGQKDILYDLSFDVEAGETLVLLGRSGSGKTTALKMVNGLLLPNAGDVLIEGIPTTAWDLIRLRRRIGYVIQDAGLFPHFTVAANVGLVPRLEGWQLRDIDVREDQLAGFAEKAFGIKRILRVNPREPTVADIEGIFRAAW